MYFLYPHSICEIETIENFQERFRKQYKKCTCIKLFLRAVSSIFILYDIDFCWRNILILSSSCAYLYSLWLIHNPDFNMLWFFNRYKIFLLSIQTIWLLSLIRYLCFRDILLGLSFYDLLVVLLFWFFSSVSSVS